MDVEEFVNPAWQRVYQYLDQHERNVDFHVDPDTVAGSMLHCLEVLLRYFHLSY